MTQDLANKYEFKDFDISLSDDLSVRQAKTLLQPALAMSECGGMAATVPGFSFGSK